MVANMSVAEGSRWQWLIERQKQPAMVVWMVMVTVGIPWRLEEGAARLSRWLAPSPNRNGGG